MVVRWWLWSQLVDLWAVVGFVFWSEIEWERGKKKRQRREKSQEWLTFSKPFRTKFWSAITSVDANLPSILHQKSYFFLFYIFIFTKHSHQFIYFTHLFNKIFIVLSFFIILSLTVFLSQTQSEILKAPKPKPIFLRTTLSLTDPNHHHTNLKILALTKHLFITSFITLSL